MSDATEPRATTPFPVEAAPAALLTGVDPLAGDWSEGLRGPVRALGIAEPRSLLLDGLPQPEERKVVSLAPIAPVADLEAPDGRGKTAEDSLQPPPLSEELPSVIITFTDPPESAEFPETTPPSASPAFTAAEAQPEVAPAAPAFQPDVTPATAAPAFLPDVTPPAAAPAFLPDVTPATAAPAFLPDVTPATAAPAFLSHDAPAAEAPSPWSEPVAGPPPAAAEPAWKETPVPMPVPAVAAVGAWDQVTATAPAVAWQMPPAQVEAAPEPVVDDAWSSPPPASEPVHEWNAEAPPDDWQEVKRPDAPVLEAPPAADWQTLSSGPDWTSAPPVEAAPAAETWGAPPPVEAASAWDAPVVTAEPAAWDAPGAAEEPAAWDAPAPSAAPAAEWSAPVVPPAPSWHAAPVGASAMEQLDAEPPDVVAEPGAAQELFGSVPMGASLSGDDSEPGEDFGPPEELSSPEEFLKPVELAEDDADLLVPIEEDAPPRPLLAQPLAALQPVGVGALFVRGEHRVAVQTRGGRTRRGAVKDVDLGKSQFSLIPQGGGAGEPVYHVEVKAIFFMLAPGEKLQPASGGKVRVTFADGRSIEGSRDGAEAKHGFFLVPADAARTNTRRIYIAREATTDIKDG